MLGGSVGLLLYREKRVSICEEELYSTSSS